MPEANLVAVPVTQLYNRGIMVTSSEVLSNRLAEPFIALNPADADAQKATDGMTVNVSFNGSFALAVVKIDKNVPAGFALVPRSCGIPVNEPVEIHIQIAVAEAAAD